MKHFFYTLFMLCLVQPAWATTFTVSNTNDAGPGSLRQAITNANGDGSATAGSPHIINFTVGGFTFINTALPAINNHITINGIPAGSIVRPAVSGMRVFDVNAFTVAFNNLQIENGDLTGTNQQGGGILNSGGTLTINNCLITDNFAGTLAGSRGGGISQTSGSLFITNSTIRQNDAQFGRGGAIHILSGTASLTDCTIHNNQSTDNGGAFYIGTGVNFSLINCTVVNNSTQFNAGVASGGLFYETGATINLSNTILANNNFNLPPLVPADLNTSNSADYSNIVTNNSNIVESCIGGGCPGFTSTADPNLAGQAICGLQDYFRPNTGSAAINAGTVAGAPAADICGTPWIGGIDIGSSESALPGSALDFDGTNDFVSTAILPALGTTWTIEFWVKNNGVDGAFDRIISNTVVEIAKNSTDLQLCIPGNCFVAPGITLPTGTWKHIAITSDGSSIKVYEDANAFPVANYFVAANIPSESWDLGKLSTASSDFGFFSIDEFRVWDRTLCYQEISDYKDCHLVGTESDLVLYYDFNQGAAAGNNLTETTVLDKTANAYNGTLNSFTLTGATSNWIDGSTNGVTGSCAPSLVALPVVQGNGTDIISGDATPSIGDDTDWGNVGQPGTYTHTFTIDNTAGGAPLNLVAGDFLFFGGDAADFAIPAATFPLNVPAGGTATFDVEFSPGAVGLRSTTLFIQNFICGGGAGNYSFALQGTGVVLEDIAITEWMTDPAGSDAQEEWIELYNYGAAAVDIQNWRIKDEDTNDAIITASSYILQPGDYVILARNKAAFEALWFDGCVKSDVIEVSGFALTNTADEIILEDDLGTTTWSVAYSDDESTGRATFDTEGTFTTRFWGSKAAPGIVRNGNDLTTGTLGYQKNNITADPNAITAINGDVGSPLNNPAAGTERVRGTVLTLDGVDDFVDVGNLPAYDFTQSSTLSGEAWINATAAGSNAQQIMSKYDGGAFQGWGFQLTNGVPTFYMSANLFEFCAIQGGSLDLRDGQNHHVAFTYDGSNDFLNGVQIYVDGILQTNSSVGTATTIAGSPVTTVNFALGAYSSGPAEFFMGTLDEVRIWTSTRTASEIRENMHLTLGSCETGSLSYFQMNDGAGTTVTDGVSGNNGTFASVPTWNTSETNVGNDLAGISVSETVAAIAAGASTQNFASANAQVDFTAHSGVEDFTITYQAFDPNATTGATGVSIHQNPMWTINKSTTTETFTANIRFTYAAPTITALNACNLKLYHRAMGSGGAWTEVASSASTFSTTTATFDGITVTGQFMVVENANPEIVRGRGLTFDGSNDFVDVAAPFTLDTDAHTIETWVKIPALPADLDRIIQRGLDGAGAGWSLALDVLPSGQISFNTCCTNAGGVTSASSLVPNQWYHVAAVYVPGATGSVTLYINGINEGTTPLTNPVLRNSTQGWILGKGNLAGEFFNGSIDEVRIWDVARTEDEIRENMHLTLNGCETGIRGYYQFNETPGSTSVPDKVGGNNGALTNMDVINAWSPQGVNVGNDVAGNSNSTTIDAIPAGVSTQNFAAANLNIDFTAHSAVENFTVTYQEYTPNATTGATGSNIINNPVWTINKSTSTETQTMNLTFTFAPATLTLNNNCHVIIYNRPMNSDAAWTSLGNATTLTGTTATFEGITTTGQFMVVEDNTITGGDIARGDALDFDGTLDHVVVLDDPALQLTTNLTLEAWVKSSDFSGFPGIFSKNDDPGFVVWIDNISGDLRSRIGGAQFGTGRITLNNWHHIAVTFDGATKRMYIDGVLQGSLIDPSPAVTGTSNLIIGNWLGTAREWTGEIDEVRIWNTTRTETDIRESMHLTLLGCESGLVAYYQMNDGSGSAILTDKSGNGHDGTLTNMDPSTDWVTSGVNVGNDAALVSNSQTINVAAGTSTPNFVNANLRMNVLAHSGAEDFTVTYQEFTPNATTGIDAVTLFDNPMWTINKSTTTETFQANLSFTYPASPFTNLDGTKYGVYWRPMNSDGSWTKLGKPSLMTANRVDFKNATLVGQYMVALESDPNVSDVRGNMYTLDGGEFIDNSTTSTGLPQGNSPRTMEAWVKTTQVGLGNIISWGRRNANMRNSLAVRSNVLGFVGESNDFNGTMVINDGQWHHVAITHDGTTLRLYVDGILDASSNRTFNTTDQNLRLGTITLPSAGENYTGSMDEVRIWNTARTQDELRENMHLTLKGNETGLVSYFQFNNDDAIGAVDGVKDAVGGSHGTTTNMESTDYTESEVAVAGGTSDRITVSAAGVVDFPNTGLSIEFGATHPNGELVVSRLETEKPHGWNSLTGDVDNEYFVIHNYGTVQTGLTPLIDMTFNRMNYISPDDVPTPQATNPIQVHKRPSNAFGATWGSALGGVGADALTAGSNGMASFDAAQGITEFSQFVILNAGPNSDLPVEIISFEAERLNKEQVQLDWTTATETNNHGFEIERMLEHETGFTNVGFVNGQGTTVNTTYYQHLDDNDYEGTTYYRLKQVDTDGSFEYSEIRAVTGDGSNGFNANIFPNPVQDQITVRFDALPKGVSSATVRVMAVNGKILHQFDSKIQSYQNLTIDAVKELAPAMYMIHIELDNGEHIAQKFIKE